MQGENTVGTERCAPYIYRFKFALNFSMNVDNFDLLIVLYYLNFATF
jgi:hypothetical protein